MQKLRKLEEIRTVCAVLSASFQLIIVIIQILIIFHYTLGG